LVNGVVTELNPVQESCPRGWRSSRDNHCTEYRTRQVKVGESCTTSSNGVRTCTPIYNTEYKYIYDWERRYFVESTLRTFEIDRVDRQGVSTPPRFSEIEINDAVTVSYEYKNYIKGASSSLFSEEELIEALPIAYPRVRDYYRANRVIFTNTESSNDIYSEWNAEFQRLNGNIRETGANAILVITDAINEDFPEALARGWHAHNINDVVTVIGRNVDTIEWVDTRSWSNSSRVNIEIENELMNLGTLSDREAINDIIENAINDHFELKSMEEFEYLADDIPPPMWAFIIAAILVLIVSPAITYLFHKHDIA